MRTLLVPFVLVLTTLVTAGCTTSDNGGFDGDVGAQQAVIETSMGAILIEFYCDAAPTTVENFRRYAMDDFYQGTIFHRIIEDFMIQGGGFTEDWDQKQTRAPIPLEYERPNVRGTVAMARTGDPNSATSQFFINTDDNTQSLGPRAGSDGYTVFARVVEGMEVVDQIAAVEVKPHRQNPEEVSEPVDPPVIQDVRVGPGCDAAEDEEPTYGVDAGLIQDTRDTDGVWHTNISAETDYVPLYVLNLGNRDDTFRATVEAPSSWEVTMSPGILELKANTAGKGTTYPYAAAGLLTVKPTGGFENATHANVTLTLESENDPGTQVVLQIRLHVDDKEYARVTKVGDAIQVDYTGSFDNGEVFDSSKRAGREPLPVTAGGQGTVTGFSYGLLGLHIGETVDIRFPPELGYGYAQSGSREQFNGEWLNFELTVTQM